MAGIEVNCGIPGKKLVALTFDDGPANSETTSKIVAVLQKAGAKATFFIEGRNAVVNSQVLREVYAAGMEIGNHTFNHRKLIGFDNSNQESKSIIKDEIIRTHQIVEDLLGFSMRQFRPPFGQIDDFTRSIIENDPHLSPLNYNTILWSVNSRDRKIPHADAVFQRVRNSPNLDGAIVLMHDGLHSTVEATRRLVPYLIEAGFTLITVSEMLTTSA